MQIYPSFPVFATVQQSIPNNRGHNEEDTTGMGNISFGEMKLGIQ